MRTGRAAPAAPSPPRRPSAARQPPTPSRAPQRACGSMGRGVHKAAATLGDAAKMTDGQTPRTLVTTHPDAWSARLGQDRLPPSTQHRCGRHRSALVWPTALNLSFLSQAEDRTSTVHAIRSVRYVVAHTPKLCGWWGTGAGVGLRLDGLHVGLRFAGVFPSRVAARASLMSPHRNQYYST